ncbi:MAG: GAF domain-containing protein [Anaerolineales bacterium]
MREHTSWWNRVRDFLSAPVFAQDEDKTRTARSLNPLLLGLFILVLLGAVATVFVFAAKLASGIGVLVLFLVVVLAKLLLERGRVREASWIFLVSTWLVSNAIVILGADPNPLIAANVSLTVIAGLVLGVDVALLVVVVSSALYLGVLSGASLGLTLPVVFPGTAVSDWLMLTMTLGMALIPLNLALRSLQESLSRARRSNLALEAQQKQLATLVAERTEDLNRRTGYLGAASAIAAVVVAVERDPQELLARVVHIISEQFGFYHAGIFMLDETRSWAELQAASSVGGQRMVRRGHRLRVGAEGIVGTVVATGEPRVAQDVGQDAVYFDNPDLPETRSEVALPLRVQDEALGALDVQSTDPQAFTEEDVAILQTIADQVAVAINNVRLLRQVEESVDFERNLYTERSQEAWRDLLQQELQISLASHEQSTLPFDGWEAQMKQAAETGQMVVGEAEGAPSVALPLKVRDQVIGVIDGRKPSGGVWTPSEITLLETVAEQLSVALESGRLYQETQRRAARERLTREITDQIRGALTVDEAVQRTLRQLGEALGAEMLARLEVDDSAAEGRLA